MTDFEQIYNEYFHDVYKYVLSLCQNETIAEDVTQETFCKAMDHLDTFKGHCRIFVWLCQIAKNTYFTLYKKNKRYVSESAIHLPDLEYTYMDNETSMQLHKLLHQLNEPYKEVFMLRVFGELSYSQIGELFSKTDSWARLVFYRAKKELWGRLNENIL